MNDMELLRKIEEISKEELEKVAKKGEVQPNEWMNLKAAVCVMKDIKEVQQMLQEMGDSYGWDEGYSSRSYNTQFIPRMTHDGMSTMRGRSRTTGRYMSRDTGRSNHSIKDRMVDSLERMYDEAQTDHERGMLDEWIRKIEASN